jgi:hypothetical protein
MIVGAIVFIFGAVAAVRAHLQNRDEEMAPFWHYFGAEYDRDLLRQSSWCDCENPSDPRTRFDIFNVIDCGASERYSRGSGTIRRNRDRD